MMNHNSSRISSSEIKDCVSANTLDTDYKDNPELHKYLDTLYKDLLFRSDSFEKGIPRVALVNV